MIRAVLTGFEPFGPYEYNPVQDLALYYNGKTLGRKQENKVEVIGLVLPCTYYGAFEVLSSEIDRLSPDMILSAGLASRVKRIRLETIGHNIMNGKYADADGKQPQNMSLIARDKWWYATTADNSSLVRTLIKQNIPAELSVDAESFICNSLIYLTSRKIHHEKLPVDYAFFHTPWTDNYLDKVPFRIGQIAIKKHDLEKSVEIILGSMTYNVKSRFFLTK